VEDKGIGISQEMLPRVFDIFPRASKDYEGMAIGAVGGWPGGLLAMLLFKHKTAKLSFKLKYGIAFVIWAGLVYTAFVWLRW